MTLPDIERLIVTLRGQKVILDADLARIYGVPTRSLNQAVKRNLRRFPLDFLFRATAEELDGMRSQFVIASDRSQTVTASKRNVRHLPYAFTEHGAIVDVLQRIMRILDPPPPPPEPPPPEMGFHVKEDTMPYGTRRKPRLPIHRS